MGFQKVPRHQRQFRRRPDWGDVYWFDLGSPVSGQKSFAGVHPVLVVANCKAILPGTTEVLPLSGSENKRAGYDFHVEITTQECPFLDKNSIVKVDQIYCILTSELPDQYYMGTMPTVVIKKVYAQLLRVLGMDKLVPP